MKQVIVLRTDLNMRKGKMCAQAAHASMKVLLDMSSEEYTNWDDSDEEEKCLLIPIKGIEEWINGSFTKIVVGTNSEKELLEIYSKAKESNLLCSLIKDEGRTEFNGIPTYTAVSVGPGDDELINKITGHLKLL